MTRAALALAIVALLAVAFSAPASARFEFVDVDPESLEALHREAEADGWRTIPPTAADFAEAARQAPPAFVADYIVVGAGNAGAAYANRLAMRLGPRYSVLLVEAGMNRLDDPSIYNAAASGGLFNSEENNIGLSNSPRYAWQSALAPDPGRWGARDVTVNGRTWGGSGAINLMNYIFGGRTIFDQEWPAGWKYDDLVPYFVSLNESIRPYRSPLKVPVTQTYLAAARNLAAAQIAAGDPVNFLINRATPGVPNVEDPSPAAPQLNHNDLPGINSVCAFSDFWFWTNQLPNGDFVRSHPGSAYLGPQCVDGNTGLGYGACGGLRVLSDVFVQKVTFTPVKNPNGQLSWRASGVQATVGQANRAGTVSLEGQTITIAARRGVALAGGAFQTPAILQRSGVGNATYLGQLGVRPLVAHNPAVGLNLFNHMSAVAITHVEGSPAAVAAFMGGANVVTPATQGFRGGGCYSFHEYDPNRPADAAFVSYRKYQVMMRPTQVLISGAVLNQFNLTQYAASTVAWFMDDMRMAPRGVVRIGTPDATVDTPYILLPSYTLLADNGALPDDAFWAQAQQVDAPVISALLGFDIGYQLTLQMNAVSQQQGLGVTLVYDYPPGYLVEALHAGLETYGINWWRYLHSRALTPASTQAERDFAALVQRLAAFWLRGNSYRDSHQSGSVGIGRAIDNSLNVLGVSGLKVVDAASFVTLPGGNTGVLASVVALRAADITAAGA